LDRAGLNFSAGIQVTGAHYSPDLDKAQAGQKLKISLTVGKQTDFIRQTLQGKKMD